MKYGDSDDSYKYEGGSDNESDSEEVNAEEFEEQLKSEKTRLFWSSLSKFFIGFLIASALFGIFYGVVSMEPT